MARRSVCVCVYTCARRVITYEMYTGVNLSRVNSFLNVRESQGMIKERCVIHCRHDHHQSLREAALACARARVCVFVQERANFHLC